MKAKFSAERNRKYFGDIRLTKTKIRKMNEWKKKQQKLHLFGWTQNRFANENHFFLFSFRSALFDLCSIIVVIIDTRNDGMCKWKMYANNLVWNWIFVLLSISFHNQRNKPIQLLCCRSRLCIETKKKQQKVMQKMRKSIQTTWRNSNNNEVKMKHKTNMVRRLTGLIDHIVCVFGSHRKWLCT